MSPVCFVGEVVLSWQHGRLFEGVVLDFVPGHNGLSELLLVFSPNYNEPELIDSSEVEKRKFENASPECQLISKTILFLNKSKEYLHR